MRIENLTFEDWRQEDEGAPDNVHFSNKTDEHPTPPWLFKALDAEFDFTLDACATDENHKCERYFTRRDDGLKQDWGDNIVWMACPYGTETVKWMKKAYNSSWKGATVVCLVPSRVDNEWWHRYSMKGEIRFIRQRLKFGNYENGAPFASAIVIFRPPEFKLVSYP